MSTDLFDSVSRLSWLVWSTEWEDRSIEQVHAVRLQDGTWWLWDGFHPGSYLTKTGRWTMQKRHAVRFELGDALERGPREAIRLARQRAKTYPGLDPETFRISATGRPES